MKTKKLLGIVLALLVAACGGGGTTGGQPEPPPSPPPVTPPIEPPALTFNMDAAYATALSSGVSSDWMPETSSASGRQVVLSYQPTTDGQFLGVTFRRSLMKTSMLQSPGSLVPAILWASTISYSLNPTVIAGQFDAQGNLTRYLGLGNLPTAAAVGQSGRYARALAYEGPTEQNLLLEQLVSWSIEADAATTAWACLTFTTSDGAVTEKDCLRIDSAGAVSGIKTQVRWDGATLTFQGDQLAASQPLPYTLLDGGRSQIQTAGTSIVNDQGTWMSFWLAHAGSGPVLPIDFATRRVAAMTLGARPSGCWGVSLGSIDEWPDRIAVRYRETQWTQACTQALVYPALLLAIPRSGKPVEWIPVPGSEAAPGDSALSAQVSSAYDLPSSGACRVLRFQATLPASAQAAASDLSVLSFALLDASGATRASTWDNVQVSIEQGFYRVVGAGCPSAPAPHGSMWPLFKLKLNGIEHEFFGAPTMPIDPSALAFQIIDSRSIDAVSAPQFLTMTAQPALASFWASYATAPVPAVDFSHDMVGAVVLPEGDACHRIDVDSVVEWPDHIEVQYRNGWIAGLACAAVYIPGAAATVFTLPLTAKPFEWVQAP